MNLLRTTSAHPDFQQLVRQLDAYLSTVNGPDHAFYSQFNHINALRYVVVAYHEAEPVGCGAFKPYDGTTVEIKRMFVDPAQRGRGVGRAVLAELECWSREEGFVDIILETSIKLPAAIHLYEKQGYERTPNYGQYTTMPDSVCFRKKR